MKNQAPTARPVQVATPDPNRDSRGSVTPNADEEARGRRSEEPWFAQLPPEIRAAHEDVLHRLQQRFRIPPDEGRGHLPDLVGRVCLQGQVEVALRQTLEHLVDLSERLRGNERLIVFADEVGRNTVGKLDYDWARNAVT